MIERFFAFFGIFGYNELCLNIISNTIEDKRNDEHFSSQRMIMVEVDYKAKLDEAVLQSDVVRIFDNLLTVAVER